MTKAEIIGQNVQNFRKELGCSQEKLANEASMSASHLRSIEHGKGNPTIDTIERLADCLAVEFDDLFKHSETYAIHSVPDELHYYIRIYNSLPPDEQKELKKLIRQLFHYVKNGRKR